MSGVLFGGWLGDQWTRRHQGGKLLTMGVGLLLGAPVGILGILSPSRAGFLIGTGIALFLYSFNVVCNGPQIHEVTPPKFAATSQAVYLFLTHYLGNLPAAPLIGSLSDLGVDLNASMAILASTGFLSGLLMLWGSRFVVQDSSVKIEKVS
jgi:hypothetical protein